MRETTVTARNNDGKDEQCSRTYDAKSAALRLVAFTLAHSAVRLVGRCVRQLLRGILVTGPLRSGSMSNANLVSVLALYLQSNSIVQAACAFQLLAYLGNVVVQVHDSFGVEDVCCGRKCGGHAVVLEYK